jgi:acyl-homoserine-lactone acylase
MSCRYGAIMVVALVACGPMSNHQPAGRSERGEILWDTWGIPHVYGKRDADVAYGLGRAQMQSHGDLLLTLYGQARGRAAEYWGAEGLALDRWMHTMSVPRRAA